MATVIPFVPLSQTPECDGEPARILSLRSRLRVRAIEEAIAEAWPEYERGIRERETAYACGQFGPRLRLVQ